MPKKKVKLTRETQFAMATLLGEGHNIAKRVEAAEHRSKQLPDDDMVTDVIHDREVYEPFQKMKRARKKNK